MVFQLAVGGNGEAGSGRGTLITLQLGSGS